MKKIIRILLADNSESDRTQFLADLTHEPDIQLVGQTDNGMELLQMAGALEPDAIVMGLMLSGIDGLDVLSELQKGKSKPKILVLSAWKNMVSITAARGADYFIHKPCNAHMVCERLRQLTAPVQAPSGYWSSHTDLENQVTRILWELGAPAHVKGFRFLREAVIIALAQPDTMDSMTKVLYPSIADLYGASPSYVERGIRRVIEVAWERCAPDVLEKYFGHTLSNEKTKPTNSEFIAVLCEYILYHRWQLTTA